MMEVADVVEIIGGLYEAVVHTLTHSLGLFFYAAAGVQGLK